MKQPIKNSGKKVVENVVKEDVQLDGSGLEYFFRVNVLDKLGINYEQQFAAKSIGRFYDFHLLDENGKSLKILIECDGDYWHKNPLFYKKSINVIQRKNKRVDELKNVWAVNNGYKLIRFWENDIKNDLGTIIKYLVESVRVQTDKILLEKSKKDGSFFK